jgi:hypothetical protein
MQSPWTAQPYDAFAIAQTSVGVVLAAITWSRPSRPAASSWVLLVAIAWAVVAPFQHELVGHFGVALPPTAYPISLKAIAALGTIAALLSARLATIAFAVLAEAVLALAVNKIPGSNWELGALHLAYVGALVGLQARARDGDVATEGAATPEGVRASGAPAWDARSFLAHDLRVFALATLLAIGVSIFVLDQSIDSSDEWAYTWQAATFAKGHAYAAAPACAPAFRNFWIFDWMGRQFSQHTPGWPYFMVPFSLLGVPQFAGAFSLGLYAAGLARLARRAARESGYAPRAVSAAGTVAALCATFSSTLLVNGGSRFPHVFAAALLTWATEAACAALDASSKASSEPSLSRSRRSELAWSFAFGSCAAMLWATRPGDGTVSATGLGLYALYALVRGRISWRALAGAAAGGILFAGLTLVVLRLQLGVWFKTGYSLNAVIYPWNRIALSWPQLGEWKYGFPLALGSYCWWPLSPAIGIAGLVALRGRGLRFAWILGVGAVATFALGALVEMQRGHDWGYGPRYELSATVAMAVGTGVALAPLCARARKSFSALRSTAAGPLTLAVTGIVFGVLRLAPLVYPLNTASVHTLNALNAEIRRQHLHKAVVFVPSGAGWMNDGLDLTMNLPLTLYPNQDVLIAMDKSPDLTECVRTHYSDRTFYTALPGTPVRLKKN